MIQIAITGGIACGKSLAGELFAAAGWAVCETDHVAHSLYAPGGPGFEPVCALFGADILQSDGHIDRTKLGQAVFSNPERLQALNAVLHPLVKDHVATWLEDERRKGAKGAAVIVPLLFEAGMETGWDAIVCIGCSRDIQQKRLLERGLTESDIAARVAAQMPIEEKMKRADYQVWNNGDRASFAAAINHVVDKVSERKN